MLEQQFKLFDEIRKISESQSRLIAADDFDQFNKSLDKRQRIIEKIKELHRESHPLMQSYESFQKAPGGKAIVPIEEAASRLRSVIEGCGRQNSSDMEASEAKREGCKEQIDKMQTNRKGLGAYAGKISYAPEVFDKMS